MEEQLDSILYSKEVIEFVTVANQLCLFFEQGQDIARKDFLDKLQKLLPLLYLKASLLPTLEPNFEDGNEKFIQEHDWQAIKDMVSYKLGAYDEYSEIYDPRQSVEFEQYEATLSENIADIYQDLKDFLMLYRISPDEIMNDAVWEVKQNFESFWGQYAVNAMRAIHYLVFHNSEYAQEIDEDYLSSESDKNQQLRSDSDSWFISQRQQENREGNDDEWE